MRNIEISVEQVGDDSFISNSNIKIRINGKFVKNDFYEIVKNSLELTNDFKLKEYEQYPYSYKITLIAKNGNAKNFYINKYDVTLNINKDNILELEKKYKNIKSFIVDIEDFIFNVSSVLKCHKIDFKRI